MIYLEEPENFSPKFEAVGCFVEYRGKIILLHRKDSCSEGNTWGLPAGKIDPGEEVSEAVRRETQEETGLIIPVSQIVLLGKTYVKFPTYDLIFYFFKTHLEEMAEVRISPAEHKGFRWISPKDALKLELIGGLSEGIKLFY